MYPDLTRLQETLNNAESIEDIVFRTPARCLRNCSSVPCPQDKDNMRAALFDCIRLVQHVTSNLSRRTRNVQHRLSFVSNGLLSDQTGP